MEKQPEFRDKWILAWFAIWFLLFLPSGFSSVPETHGAYWREVLILPLMMATVFTVLAGLVRPVGWLSLGVLYFMSSFLPGLGSPNLHIYFFVVSYFTLFFSVGERLTPGKILNVAVAAGAVLTLAYLLDPGLDRGDFGQGVVNWLALIPALMVVHSVQRATTWLFRRKEVRSLDWLEDA